MINVLLIITLLLLIVFSFGLISRIKIIKLNKQKNDCFEYFNKQAKQLEEYKKFRHDYKNKLAGLKALLENDEYGRASEYLSDLLKEVNVLTDHAKNYSDNTLIDSVLQNLAVRCEESGITFDASVIVGNDLPLSDTDICSVFYNIANNAYEAASKQYDGEKFITFLTSRRQKWLIITAENSFNGKLTTKNDGQIATTKEDSDFHGFGLSNIKSTVEAVPGASVKIETEGNIFRIALIFPK